MSLSSCSADLPYSCTNTTAIADLCCFESPGGVVVSTQFWDYNPATGPSDAFTLHGLWPDNCDGTYEENCDSSMNVNDVASIINSFGDTDLLTYMETYWKNLGGSDETLWEHEFNTHGTCYSTIKSSCYGSDMKSGQNVYDFFTQATTVYKDLPTYDWLSSVGITPSTTATYTKDEIVAALKDKFGAEPYIDCDDDNAIQQVWYFYHLKGSLINGTFQPIDSLSTSGCSASGIKFMPKSTSSSGTTTTSKSTTTATSTSPATTSKGYIEISGQAGCLISNGKWYVSGTCATYTLTPVTGGYNLKSSSGTCGIDSGAFTCGSGISATTFGLSGATITVDGDDAFSADKVPSGSDQEVVSMGSGVVGLTLVFSDIS